MDGFNHAMSVLDEPQWVHINMMFVRHLHNFLLQTPIVQAVLDLIINSLLTDTIHLQQGEGTCPLFPAGLN